MYDHENINRFIQAHPGKVGDKPVITIYFNMTIYRVVIFMDVGCELDLAERDFASLLGFEKKILKEVANSLGDKIPNKR